MHRGWQLPAKVLTGCLFAAVTALPQAYTISAKPGVVNHIEGNVFLNGKPLTGDGLKTVSMAPNDVVSTDIGKAEVLLSPGVFLRLGDNSQVRMVSPSLTDTQIELKSGSAMVEVDDLVKDNHLTVLNHGGTLSVQKPGLYRVSADDPPTVATLEGKAVLFMGDGKVDVGKGREVVVAAGAKATKFDTKRDDELYAWSNVRSQYDAASSYQVAKNVSVNSFNDSGWNNLGFGYGSAFSPGWFWNSGFNSWAWLPGSGAFYNPFGFGFYSPGWVGYAPVVYAPVSGGGGASGTGKAVQRPVTPGTTRPTGVVMAAIPVNPSRPGAVGMAVASPHASAAASSQVMRAYGLNGFATASGVRVPAGGFYGAPAGVGRAPVASASPSSVSAAASAPRSAAPSVGRMGGNAVAVPSHR